MKTNITDEIKNTHTSSDSQRRIFINRMERKLEIKEALYADKRNHLFISGFSPTRNNSSLSLLI